MPARPWRVRQVNRPNLEYRVEAKPDSAQAAVAAMAGRIRTAFPGLSGIVYCLTRKVPTRP